MAINSFPIPTREVDIDTIASAYQGRQYTTGALFVADVAAGYDPQDGTVVSAGGLAFVRKAPDWLPFALLERDSVAGVLADELWSYSPTSPFAVTAGQRATTKDGFSYEVAPSDATDQHVTTAGEVKLYVLPSSEGTVSPRAFGAVIDGATDDRAAFLAAFKAGGRIGHKVVWTGIAFFADTLVLDSTTLGFAWKNLYAAVAGSSSPYSDGGGFVSSGIRTNGKTAIRITLDSFGHERIEFTNVSFDNLSVTVKVGTSAIEVLVDGNRSFSYPNGWFFDRCGSERFENFLFFKGINMPAQNNRFSGLIDVTNLHTWRTTYSINVDGMYLNFFRGRNARLHFAGSIRLGANSGGFFFLDNFHHETANPARFVINTNALPSLFSLKDLDGENNGDGAREDVSGNRPDGFVIVEGSGNLLNQHEFVFSGVTRIPSFSETAPEIPAGIALSNYTQAPIFIVPKGCTIRTPDTVRIVAPPASGSSGARHFRFFVPLDRIKGRSGERFVAQPTTGRMPTGSNPFTNFRRAKRFPGFEATNRIARSTTFAGQQTGPVFSCAHVMDVTRNSTRPWGNPIPISINGSASNHFLGAELANGPVLCVYGLSMGGGVLESFEPPAPTSPGPNWITSPGILSFGEDNLMASDYFFPANYAQTFEQECAAGGQIDIRVNGTNSASITDGLSGTITVTVDDGLRGSGEWRFVVRSDGRQVTEVYNSTVANITLSTPTVSNFDLINVRLANATAGAVKARALIKFD